MVLCGKSILDVPVSVASWINGASSTGEQGFVVRSSMLSASETLEDILPTRAISALKGSQVGCFGEFKEFWV